MSRKYNSFIEFAFKFSTKSPKTQQTYRRWIYRLCEYTTQSHPLDISPRVIQTFYLSLYDSGFSLSSLTVVRSALVYFYTVLCTREAPEICRYAHTQRITEIFQYTRKHSYNIPIVASQSEMKRFCALLPETTVGNIIQEMYRTGHKFERILESFPITISCSKGYAQQVAAKTARKVGIAHGFGLRGIRASGIVHAIQNRKDDTELVRICKDSGLSYQQFRLYRKAAGEFSS